MDEKDMGVEPGEEKRQFQRVKVSFIVIYKVDSPLSVRMMVQDKEVPARMQDLCEGGVGVTTEYDIPPMTQLLIEFVLVNENAPSEKDRVRPMNIAGEVRYSRPEGKGEHRLGICFTEVSDDDRRVISEFVNMLA